MCCDNVFLKFNKLAFERSGSKDLISHSSSTIIVKASTSAIPVSRSLGGV